MGGAKDRCFIGSRLPPLIGQCCHGKDEAAVYRQLTAIVSEWVALYNKEGKPLPASAAGKDYSGKFVLRVQPWVAQASQPSAPCRKATASTPTPPSF